MKEIYNEYFHVPKDGKVREKVMLMRTALTVAVMVACLAAMAIIAYAYFGDNITSTSSVITAANFEAKVSIKIGELSDKELEIEYSDKRVQVATLVPGNTYKVTIEKEGTAKTGFCSISAIGCDAGKYFTQQIGTDVNALSTENDSISFTLTVTDTTAVSFQSHWGTSSYYDDYVNNGTDDELYILDGDTVVMEINGISAQDDGEDEEQSEEETTAVEAEKAEPIVPDDTVEATPPANGNSTPDEEKAEDTADAAAPEANEPTVPADTGAEDTGAPEDTKEPEVTQPVEEENKEEETTQAPDNTEPVKEAETTALPDNG